MYKWISDSLLYAVSGKFHKFWCFWKETSRQIKGLNCLISTHFAPWPVKQFIRVFRRLVRLVQLCAASQRLYDKCTMVWMRCKNPITCSKPSLNPCKHFHCQHKNTHIHTQMWKYSHSTVGMFGLFISLKKHLWMLMWSN